MQMMKDAGRIDEMRQQQGWGPWKNAVRKPYRRWRSERERPEEGATWETARENRTRWTRPHTTSDRSSSAAATSSPTRHRAILSSPSPRRRRKVHAKRELGLVAQLALFIEHNWHLYCHLAKGLAQQRRG